MDNAPTANGLDTGPGAAADLIRQPAHHGDRPPVDPRRHKRLGTVGWPQRPLAGVVQPAV